ncbi:hypothetical protein L2E82_38465 [Cichorium intybus]|uniref:Uncharacterized protein n=1 Tax=Cichorium intybus TaxID=13427 RepID=A0ACB9AG17_CICIN|nr:hypothetical protein L2E82_38465 [Cichorium intybus]
MPSLSASSPSLTSFLHRFPIDTSEATDAISFRATEATTVGPLLSLYLSHSPSSHHFGYGPSKITSMSFSKVVGSGARDMLTGTDAYNDASSDATLFQVHYPFYPMRMISNNTENDFQSLECNDLLEDLEDHAIGNLLPEKDELLAGVMDGFDLNAFPSRADELEEYDLFGSGGGMELESDMDSLNMSISKVGLTDGVVGNGVAHYNLANGVATVAGEHPYGEHPSRILFVRNINSNVEDSELITLFEQYGNIWTLYTACKHRGFVMISYYDIRVSRTAMRALQNKPLRRRKLDIHYSIPKLSTHGNWMARRIGSVRPTFAPKKINISKVNTWKFKSVELPNPSEVCQEPGTEPDVRLWFELGKLYKKWYLDLAPKAADLSRCGYMPSDLYKLNSAYGTQEELRYCIEEMHNQHLLALGDVVLNHRCAHKQSGNGVWNILAGKFHGDPKQFFVMIQNFRVVEIPQVV